MSWLIMMIGVINRGIYPLPSSLSKGRKESNEKRTASMTLPTKGRIQIRKDRTISVKGKKIEER